MYGYERRCYGESVRDKTTGLMGLGIFLRLEGDTNWFWSEGLNRYYVFAGITVRSLSNLNDRYGGADTPNYTLMSNGRRNWRMAGHGVGSHGVGYNIEAAHCITFGGGVEMG